MSPLAISLWAPEWRTGRSDAIGTWVRRTQVLPAQGPPMEPPRGNRARHREAEPAGVVEAWWALPLWAGSRLRPRRLQLRHGRHSWLEEYTSESMGRAAGYYLLYLLDQHHRTRTYPALYLLTGGNCFSIPPRGEANGPAPRGDWPPQPHYPT